MSNGNNLERDDFIQLLILEVEKRPILYAKSMNAKGSSQEYSDNWTEIATKLNSNVNKCIRTWTYVLNTFKHLSLKEHASLLSSWTYFKKVQFLIHCRNKADLLDNFDSILKENTASVKDNKTSVKLSTTPAHLDNNELFLLSFLPIFSRLTNKQNAMARMRILKTLYKVEFDDID